MSDLEVSGFDAADGIGSRRGVGSIKRYAQAILRSEERIRKGWRGRRRGRPKRFSQSGYVHRLAAGQRPEPYPEQMTFLNGLVESKSLEAGVTITTVVDNHLSCEVRSPTRRTSKWFYIRNDKVFWSTRIEEYVFFFPRLFFRILFDKSGVPTVRALRLCNGDERRVARELLRAHRIVNVYRVESYDHNEEEAIIKIRLGIESTIVPYPRGRLCCCLPVPGRGERRQDTDNDPLQSRWIVDSPEIVVSSPCVADALEHLSRVWQDRYVKTVLISAPPGSGKEVLALSNAYGSGRNTERIQEMSLAEGNTEEQERRLFGWTREDGSVVPGLIDRAAKSTLFIDEAHYPIQKGQVGIRASLLRLLEAGSYAPQGSTEVKRVDDVLFVFATSWRLRRGRRLRRSDRKRPKSLSELDPPDFWTRIGYKLEFKHPLEFRGRKEETVGHLFLCFWWEVAEKYFGREIELADVEPSVDKEGVPTDPKELLKRRQLQDLFDSRLLRRMTSMFARELRRAVPVLSRLSIRGIRSIAFRTFSFAVSRVSVGKPLTVNDREFLRELRRAIADVKDIASVR